MPTSSIPQLLHTKYLSITQTNITCNITAGIVLSVFLTACSTLPIDKGAHTLTSSTMTSPLTAKMPAVDRTGRIAYVEEQGAGSTKVSSLYSIYPDGSDRQLIDELSGYIYAPAWSADGQLLAYSKQTPRQNPKIYIYDVGRQTHNLVVGTEGSNLSPSFSPDGQKLLYSSTVGGDADIYEMHLDSGKTKQLTTLPSTEVQPSYASDGQSFVYTSDKKNAGRPRIYRYDFATRNATQITMKDYAASPQLSFDGQRLAYLNDRQAAILTLATGEIVKLAETGLDEPARFSPSGQYSVYPTRTSRVDGQSGGSIVIHSLAGQTSYAISSKAGGIVRSPIWGQ
ncbi:Xaa-Pro aminopeptidase [Psychrobacter sp. FBL11]|uniref:Xaa-Pro aminopeptidase n=1 Tax=Psychrobacter saeujeotis TaxID=3143436 RepID=A0ABU9XAA2_9GAMM|nr:Xaa-Pro aminopeptidase [uncultured Psychrobacter sp.]